MSGSKIWSQIVGSYTMPYRVKGALAIQPDFKSVLQNMQQFFHRLTLDPPGGAQAPAAQPPPVVAVRRPQLELEPPRAATAVKQAALVARGKQGSSFCLAAFASC